MVKCERAIEQDWWLVSQVQTKSFYLSSQPQEEMRA